MSEKQILLSKFLFDSASNAFDPNDSFSCGLAISLLHDSVETLIWAIVKELDAPARPQSSFEELWDSIPKAKFNTNQKSLPLRARIIELNKARVNFKHYGNLPDASDATKFLGYVQEFLNTATKEFLSVSFEDVSLADLVRNENVKKFIKAAEQEYKKQEWQNVLVECADAERESLSSLNTLFPKVDRNFRYAGDHIGSGNSSDVGSMFRYLSDYLDGLRSVSVASIVGVRLPEYIRFKNIVPSVHYSMSGVRQVQLFGTKAKVKAGEQEAMFCIRYVTRLAINVQTNVG